MTEEKAQEKAQGAEKTEKVEKGRSFFKTALTLTVIAAIVGFAFLFYQDKKIEEQKVSQSKPQTPQIINIQEAGVFNFELQPLEGLENWWYVEKGLRYSFSSTREGHAFFVKYKRGDLIKVDGDKINIPDKAGPFKLVAGEQEVKITLLVSRSI